MRIAIFLIATNKYISFFDQIYASIKKYFLVGHEIKIFLFTNHENLAVPFDVEIVKQEHKPFPYPTLMRYHIFSNSKNKYENFDYYYYLDVDMRIVDFVGEEVFGDIVATRHPGFYNQKRNSFTYENRNISTAYIPPNKGEYYFCGGFQGGKKYLEMAEKIKKNIDIDSANGITAIWHDESHYNKYLSENKPDVMLDSSYCYPEQNHLAEAWGLKVFNPKIIALDKNHAEMRG